MRLRTTFIFIAIFAIVLMTFQSVEAGKKKKIKKLLKYALTKIPQKKILIPLPLPIPLIIPTIIKRQKVYVQESVPYAYGGHGGGGGGGGGY